MLYVGCLLVLVHGIFLFWATGGYLEMILSEVPWKPFTNPEFPTWVLLIHWGSILFAAVSFMYGYFTKWPHTPQIMLVAYGLMALVCIIETFGYMTSQMK